MANHLLSQFPQDEQDDFLSICKKYGRFVEEFQVIDEDQYPAGGGGVAIKRQVTVALRGKTAISIYDAGHAGSWTVDFENDLKAGTFR